MTTLVVFILVFVTGGALFLAGNLFVGKLIRSSTPSPEKGEVYECGEQPIGSAWVQFDLRFYVVALLFVIFDVEVAFFFPWAVVFGSANQAADIERPPEQRAAAVADLYPPGTTPPQTPPDPAAMRSLGRIALLDMLVFFGILLVGFAYLWKRGDLEWVRSLASQTRQSGSLSTAEMTTASETPALPLPAK